MLHIAGFFKVQHDATQPKNSNQLMDGMYNCPCNSVGYLIFTFGQKFNRTASFINVNEPLIKACEAITAAIVAITIPNGWNQSSIIK